MRFQRIRFTMIVPRKITWRGISEHCARLRFSLLQLNLLHAAGHCLLEYLSFCVLLVFGIESYYLCLYRVIAPSKERCQTWLQSISFIVWHVCNMQTGKRTMRLLPISFPRMTRSKLEIYCVYYCYFMLGSVGPLMIHCTTNNNSLRVN